MPIQAVKNIVTISFMLENYHPTVVKCVFAIFIAITALCRLIILQGKGINTVDLLYESGAILLLALSALAIRWNLINLVRPKGEAERETE